MFSRKSIKLPDARDMAKALADVRAIQPNHDARLMLLVFLDRAAHVGSQLKALGIETDDTLKSLFDSAFEQSKKVRPAPKKFDPTVQTGKPS